MFQISQTLPQDSQQYCQNTEINNLSFTLKKHLPTLPCIPVQDIAQILQASKLAYAPGASTQHQGTVSSSAPVQYSHMVLMQAQQNFVPPANLQQMHQILPPFCNYHISRLEQGHQSQDYMLQMILNKNANQCFTYLPSRPNMIQLYPPARQHGLLDPQTTTMEIPTLLQQVKFNPSQSTEHGRISSIQHSSTNSISHQGLPYALIDLKKMLDCVSRPTINLNLTADAKKYIHPISVPATKLSFCTSFNDVISNNGANIADRNNNIVPSKGGGLNKNPIDAVVGQSIDLVKDLLRNTVRSEFIESQKAIDKLMCRIAELERENLLMREHANRDSAV